MSPGRPRRAVGWALRGPGSFTPRFIGSPSQREPRSRYISNSAVCEQAMRARERNKQGVEERGGDSSQQGCRKDHCGGDALVSTGAMETGKSIQEGEQPVQRP